MRIQLHIPLGLLLGGTLSMIASPAAAQTTATGVGRANIPIHGHTGIIQEPINTAQMYEGVNRIAVALGFGSRRPVKLYRMDAVQDMERGMPVVVHYETNGDQTASAEGRLTSVDRAHGRIAIQYSDGRIEKLRVTHHPPTGTLHAEGQRVIVYSSDKSGQQLEARYFKRKT